MMEIADVWMPEIEKFEGRVNHMYLDTRGNVTVGVGLMLPDVNAAQALPFNGTPMEIGAEWHRVKGMRTGLAASAYHGGHGLVLTNDAVSGLFRKTLSLIWVQLLRLFEEFPDYPQSARVALADMAYNLGVTKLRSDYPLLLAAVAREDWGSCAAQCHRRGISDERNQWCRLQFLSAAKGEIQ